MNKENVWLAILNMQIKQYYQCIQLAKSDTIHFYFDTTFRRENNPIKSLQIHKEEKKILILLDALLFG